ncbi:MAG: hypothetical protein EOP84_11905 [Verrucomicrobiaceae bacterium]|nr:MAG: hypothetical protein EOP84_11905 [Verrucomicrobiaceae bacterium]
MALSLGSEKAGGYPIVGSSSVHAQDRRLPGGGARLGFHGGRSWKSFFIGSPQHGQETMWGGFSGTAAAAPMSKGRPVWKAIRHELRCSGARGASMADG